MPKKKRGTWPRPLRFEANYGDPALAFDPLVDEVFAELKSSFLEMPRGDGFVFFGAGGGMEPRNSTASLKPKFLTSFVRSMAPRPLALHEKQLKRPSAA